MRRLSILLLFPVIAAGCSSNDGDNSEASSQTVAVTISDEGCLPRQMSAKAGKTTFKVHNDGSASVTEFEVLQGTKVLGEVENVVPGKERSFSLTLAAGTYVTYCPNGKVDKGVLEVA